MYEAIKLLNGYFMVINLDLFPSLKIFRPTKFNEKMIEMEKNRNDYFH